MLNICVALDAEARAIAERLRLKRDRSTHAFSLYEADDVRLIVSGIGITNISAAVGFMAGQRNVVNELAVWLNVGIAGHGQLSTGTLFRANKIIHHVTGQVWYPIDVLHSTIAGSALITVPQVQTEYEACTGYDMEGAGFMTAALRFSSSELVQCLKIVSDNAEHPVDAITPSGVDKLLRQSVANIVEYAHRLHLVAQSLNAQRQTFIATRNDAICARKWAERWRFSVSQQFELQRLLHALSLRLNVDLTIEFDRLEKKCSNHRQSREVLRELNELLTVLPVSLSRTSSDVLD